MQGPILALLHWEPSREPSDSHPGNAKRMARRGHGEDGIYFDHAADCRDSAHHRTWAGRWRGVVSLGFSADGQRLRKKVSGKTRTEVKDKLRDLHAELDAGVRTQRCYTGARAPTDWLNDG